METISKYKNRKNAAGDMKLKVSRIKKTGEDHPQKLVPGKSLEQIRQEALQLLREMGIFF